MPSYIIKPRKDEDFYVVWSTVVDTVTGWGTRKELEGDAWLGRRKGAADAERFDRADEKGSSTSGEIADWYTWDDPMGSEFVLMNHEVIGVPGFAR